MIRHTLPVVGERFRFEQFFAVRRLRQLFANVAFSPDGREIAYSTDSSGQFNLWTQPLRDGCARQRTTFEEEAARNVSWLPDGSFVLFADHHGNEMLQLYRLGGDRPWPERITRRDDVRHHWAGDHALAPDGRSYAFAANERIPTALDVMARDLETGETRILASGELNHSFGGWSPDGRRILAAEVRANTDQEVFLIGLRDGERRSLTPHEGEMVNIPFGFTADGKGAYLLTDRDHEHDWLARVDLASGKHEPIERGEWDVEAFARTADASRIAWVVNEDGRSVIRARDERTGRALRVAQLPAGHTEEIVMGADGRLLAARHSHPQRTQEVFLLALGGDGCSRLTDSFLGGVPEDEMVVPEVVHFRSLADDGLDIPAWLYRPKGASRERPVPAILSIHGGPEAQERPIYFPHYQYLLHRGVAVLAPNVRGSTGYGKSHQRLIHHDWGGKELQDFEACARYLQSLGWVDSSRLGVFGGSFGGFATLECITRLPQYWAAAVELVGPSNLVTFAKAVPPHWKSMMKKWVGDPETEADFLLERSPITYVDNIRCPLLVVQGAQDPRVVRGESDQMVERLRSLGREVEYLVYEDEGHGMTKRSNLQSGNRATADFFLRRFGLGGVGD